MEKYKEQPLQVFCSIYGQPA